MATVLDAGRRVFSNLKYIYFTPWADESRLGENTYDLVNIVGDTTSSEQDENEVNEIAHEFSSEPLYENVNLGKKNFSTECIDFQNDVLKELFGWTIDANGNAMAPITYKPLYCKIEMGFNSTEDIIVLPKVKLNSRAVIASMKTDAAKGNITGTCYSAFVTAGGLTKETDMAVISKNNASDYGVSATGVESTTADAVKLELTSVSATSINVSATGGSTYEWYVNGVKQAGSTDSLTHTAKASTCYEIVAVAISTSGAKVGSKAIIVNTPKA